ncbi:branched-chain amino acid ABC transporter permease [Tistrella mobilis]|uniref:branched-chain amino acid ABC transporter permease n=1 Tax=Tistrella mobilis TaxID=171437 RepID=UPI003558F376
MLNWIISGDHPRSRILTIVLLVVLLGLAFAPFVFPGTRSLAVAARICVLIVLVASYDILLGYTGIVSFAHTMFFGIGAYGVAISLNALGPSWGAVGLGTVAGVLLSIVVAAVIGLLSLRVRAIFFSMITLAVASFFLILASQLSWLTGGEDGMSFSIPRLLSPAFKLVDGEVLGQKINGRIIAYYMVFLVSLLLFLFMLRVVNSPFGRVLQAIRENDFRAEALGNRVVIYRTAASCLVAALAALAGVLNALWLRYTGPDATLSFAIMLDVLLMVVIGGMGTLYGAVIGVVILSLAQFYLQDLMGTASAALAGIPILPELIAADRWMLWLGILFVLSVYFFPSGIVGKLRER